MPETTLVKRAFNGGEVAPWVEGRTDLAQYDASSRRIENFIPTPQGGLTRRPGTRYLRTLTGEYRVIDFVVAKSDAYLVLLGDYEMRFVRNGTPLYYSDVTADARDVSTTAEQIEVEDHGFYHGQKIQLLTTGGAPGGLSTSTDYYVVLPRTIECTQQVGKTFTSIGNHNLRPDMGPYEVRGDDNNSMDAAARYWVDTTATGTTFDLTQEKFTAAPAVTTGMSGFVTVIPHEEAIRNTFRLSTDPTALEANVVNITSAGTGPHVFGTVADEEVVLRTPWSIAEAWELDYTQDESTLYLFHKDHHPYELRRFNTSAFRLVPLELVVGPFGDIAPAGEGVEAAINTSIPTAQDYFQVVEVELTGGYFKGTHAGTSFRKGYDSSSTRSLNKSIIGQIERLTDNFMHFLPLTNAFFDQPSSNQITITSHPFTTDEPVCIVQGDGTMAAELSERVVYYIRDIGANTIELATAPGGGTMTLTPGSGTDHQIVSLWLLSTDEDGASASHPFSTAGEKYGCLWALGELPEGFEIGRKYDVNYVSSTVVTLSDMDGNLIPVTSAGDGRFFLSAGEGAVKADMRVTVDPRAQNIYSSTVIGSTIEWYDSAWNGDSGWPSRGAFHQQRLVCANSDDFPETAWASAVGDYTDFSFDSRSGAESEDYDRSIVDSSGFSYRLLGGRIGGVQWLYSGQGLLVGAESAIATIAASTNREALTPLNANVEVRQRSGVSSRKPVDAFGDAIYESNSGRSIQAAVFDGQSGAFAIDDIALIADHINQVTVKQIAWQTEPYGVIWVLKTDGALWGCTYSSRQSLAAWHRHVLGGTDATVESIAVIPEADDHGQVYDRLYLVVTRTVDGGTVRFLEYLDSPLDPSHAASSAYYVDAGIVYSGSSTATITGLTHLEGESVAVWAAGAEQASKTVASGQITIDTAATVVVAGLAYNSIWESLPFEAALEQQTTVQGNRSRIVDASFRLYRSLGGQIGPSLTKLRDIDYREPSDLMDTAIPLFTGIKKINPGGGFANESVLSLQVSGPPPFHIVMLAARTEWSDRA